MKWLLEPVLKLLGLGTNLTDPKQYLIKVVKRYKYRIEASMKYVFVDERSGEYSDISDERRKKLKGHFRKQIFDAS